VDDQLIAQQRAALSPGKRAASTTTSQARFADTCMSRRGTARVGSKAGRASRSC